MRQNSDVKTCKSDKMLISKSKCDKMQTGQNVIETCKYNKICAKFNLLYKNYVLFAFCSICILSHWYFVLFAFFTFAFRGICIFFIAKSLFCILLHLHSRLHFVLFDFYHVSILFHFHFVVFAFCYICI